MSASAAEPRRKVWRKAPSPCVSVCKFRDKGHCIACRMTKPEKRAFKRLKKKGDKKDFFRELVMRLEATDRLAYWTRMYRRKCSRKDATCPLDRLQPARERGEAA